MGFLLFNCRCKTKQIQVHCVWLCTIASELIWVYLCNVIWKEFAFKEKKMVKKKLEVETSFILIYKKKKANSSSEICWLGVDLTEKKKYNDGR